MAVQGSVQMGEVIFQEEESVRKKTEREGRRGIKETGIEWKETKMERVQVREEKRE